jgi:hypothetical protein
MVTPVSLSNTESMAIIQLVDQATAQMVATTQAMATGAAAIVNISTEAFAQQAAAALSPA